MLNGDAFVLVDSLWEGTACIISPAKIYSFTLLTIAWYWSLVQLDCISLSLVSVWIIGSFSILGIGLLSLSTSLSILSVASL